ncbi:MAG: hypothetical protein WBD24_03585 [Candidatus Omnitrophota bacterium]
MIRSILFLLTIYLIYVVYRKYQNTQIEPKINDPGKVKVFSKSSCPSPKTFIDYTEGRIKGEKKKAIGSHIAHCKDCQDALKSVFGMSTGSGQKQVSDRTK